MKALLFLVLVGLSLTACEKKDDPYKQSTGAGGAGPGYDGTGSGPAATNVNQETNR